MGEGVLSLVLAAIVAVVLAVVLVVIMIVSNRWYLISWINSNKVEGEGLLSSSFVVLLYEVGVVEVDLVVDVVLVGVVE